MKKKIRLWLWIARNALFGWGVLGIARLFIERDKRIILFTGGFGGNYSDNSKYLYNYCRQFPELQIYFVTWKREVYEELDRYGLQAVRYQNWRCKLLLLKAGYVVMDNIFACGFFVHHARGATTIQLWHGVGFKQLPYRRKLPFLERWIGVLVGSADRFGRYPDWFISTSNFYIERVFRPDFHATQFVNYGQPRNDVLFRKPTVAELMGCDLGVIDRVQSAVEQGKKIILYAPTYRPWNPDIFNSAGFDIGRFERLMEQNNAILLIKSHPFLKTPVHNGGQSVLIYDSNADLYPLFRYIDCIITDYSSIYSDYLLLDRPVLFYAFDLSEYCKHGAMQFDYTEVTPGAIVKDMTSLLDAVEHIIQCSDDGYAEKRRAQREQIFDYQDGNSAARIFENIIGRHSTID